MRLDYAQELIDALPEKHRGGLSDGYHSFDELYDHRCILFISLVNLCQEMNDRRSSRYEIFKCVEHHDSSRLDGWFLCVIKSHVGQISYHLPDKYWDLLRCPAYLRSPIPFDGHTSDDVLQRLKKLFCED